MVASTIVRVCDGLSRIRYVRVQPVFALQVRGGERFCKARHLRLILRILRVNLGPACFSTRLHIRPFMLGLLWYPPLAALGFAVGVPSLYLAGVIACLSEETFATPRQKTSK